MGGVVVASFTSVPEAEIARGVLLSEGLDARLQDDALIGVAWHLSNAVGGVKLLVPLEQVERALAVLRAPSLHVVDEDEAEEPADPDLFASRALKSALIGVVLLPVVLHLWSAWQLVLLSRAGGPRSARARREAWAARVIDGVVLCVAFAAGARLLVSP